jgi:hypothetical protein
MSWGTDRRFVSFELFTVVTMKNAVFWDVALCRYSVNRRFGGKYRLNLRGTKIRERRINLSIYLQSAASRNFIPRRWRRYVPPNRRFTKYLHGLTSQKTAFFMIEDIFTSFPLLSWITLRHWRQTWSPHLQCRRVSLTESNKQTS